MRLYLRLEVHLRGQVGGLCGNFDGDTENDFTTRQGVIESTPELFGNSWKVSPSCPDVEMQDLHDPCAVSLQICPKRLLTMDFLKILECLNFAFSVKPPQSDMGQEKVCCANSGALFLVPH